MPTPPGASQIPRYNETVLTTPAHSKMETPCIDPMGLVPGSLRDLQGTSANSPRHSTKPQGALGIVISLWSLSLLFTPPHPSLSILRA
ncbi:hypothetical protein WJX79_004879 [Trebouxia sp. C0005]